MTTFKSLTSILSMRILLLGHMALLIISCNPKTVATYDLIINEISPTQGLRTGGDTLTLSGSGLNYLKSVTIDGETCENLTISSDRIARCIIPAHDPQDVDVVVVNSIGESVSFRYTYLNTPIISSINPSFGTHLGGTPVTIAGIGFEPGAVVSFGTEECDDVEVLSEELITCTTKPYSSGLVTTTITNPDGTSISSKLFSFRPEPTVTSITPSGGSLSGGTEVEIIGTGFSFGAQVLLGSVDCWPVVVLSSTRLTCVTGAQSAGVVDVTVTNSTGLFGTTDDLYTYRPGPEISSFSPTFAPATLAGQEITISGDHFEDGATVKIGSSVCDIDSISDEEIKCTTNLSSAGSFSVVVTNPDTQTGTRSGFTFTAPPSISSITPEFVQLSDGGEEIEISGSGFTASSEVKIGEDGLCSSIELISASKLKCILIDPLSPTFSTGEHSLTVENTDLQTDTLDDGFAIRGSPSVTSLNPSGGPLAGQTTITISGDNFYEEATVKIGTVDCTSVTVVDINTITCVTPAQTLGFYPVVVTNNDSNASTEVINFTYQAAPEITDINPARGALAGGTFVTITGTNFLAGAQVYFGENSCTSGSVNSLPDDVTQITCDTPLSETNGPVNVVVVNSDGQSDMLGAGFNYQNVFLEWSESDYDYGNASMTLSKVFTLYNSTDSVQSAEINISIGGEDPGLWVVDDEDDASTCYDNSDVTLPIGDSCEVKLNFLGGGELGSGEGVPGVYGGLLIAANTKPDGDGETAVVTLDGAIVEALIELQDEPVEFNSINPQILTVINNGEASTTTISVNLSGEGWSITANNCTDLEVGETCDVTIDKGSATGPASISISANAGGLISRSLILEN